MASIVVETNVPIPMRDGARLFADIYRPSPSGRYRRSYSVLPEASVRDFLADACRREALTVERRGI